MSADHSLDQVVPPELQTRLTQFAMDNAFISIYWVGRDARIYYANNYACAMLGYTKNELLQLAIPDIDPNYPISKWDEHWQRLKHERTDSFETMHRHKDGRIIPVWVTANYVALDGYEYNVGFARDIAERKRAEAVLRANEEFYRSISESLDDFIAVLDLNGRRIYNNPAYLNFFGDPHVLRGTDSFHEVHPDDRERIRQLFQSTVQSGVGHRAEFRFVLPDGGIRHMESSGALIRNSRGEPLRVIVISRDITERKRAEEEIHGLAFLDPLTKLPNRRLLRDRLEQMMAHSQRSGLHNAMMFLDLDNFKALNDTHGHDAGDALLVEASQRIRGCIREMDTVGRFGGDEFVVLLSELDSDREVAAREASSVGEKIRSALAAPYLLTVPHRNNADQAIEHRCASSIGVVMFGKPTAGAEEVIRSADQAMYRAKTSGGNQLWFCDVNGQTGATS